MQPAYLSDSYKLYKEETTAFLTWLTNTGLQLGYDLTNGAPSRGLKAMTLQSFEMINSSQIIPLAELIASGPRRLGEIPAGIKRALRLAIKNRERCNVWHRQNPEKAEEDRTKDLGHFQFILILKEAAEVLDTVAVEKKPLERKVSAPPEEPKLTTLFENLKVHDILDDEASEIRSAAAPKEQAASSKHKAKPERKFTVKEVEDDPEMTLFCLLEDLARLRAFLQETWSSRKAGSISSICASMVTNTALDFAKALEEESLEACSSLKGWQDTVSSLNKASTPKKGLEEASNELTLPELHTVLTKFRDLSQEKFKGYITRFIRQYTDSKHLKEPDKLEVLTMLPLYQRLLKIGILPGKDQFTLVLQSLLETKKVKLHTVFGLQIYMDVLFIMRGDIGSGFQDLRKTAKRVQQSAGKFFSYQEKMLPPLDSVYVEGLRGLQESGAYYAKEFDPKKDIELLTLSNHPLGHGLENGMMTLSFYEAGKRIADHFAHVRDSLHLYNALLQEKKLEGAWPAMEDTIEYFTPEKVFVGPRPLSRPEYLRRCELADGASLTNYAKDTRNMDFKKTSNSQRSRSLFEDIPVVEMLCQRYLEPPDKSRPILAQNVVEDIVGAYAAGKNKNSHKGRLRKQWRASHKIGPVQLLTMLRDAISEAEPRLSFDFFAAHCRAWRILGTVYTLWEEQLSQKFPYLHRIEEQNVDRVTHTVPLMVFSLCLSTHKDTKRLGESIMARAAQVVEVFRADEERQALNANCTFGAGVFNESQFVGIAKEEVQPGRVKAKG